MDIGEIQRTGNIEPIEEPPSLPIVEPHDDPATDPVREPAPAR